MLAASNFKASAYTVPLALANSGEENIIKRNLTEQNYHLFSDLYFLTGVIFMATIIVGLIVAAVLFLAARQLYKDKKSGKSSCGGNCAGCPRACGHCGDVKNE